MAIVVVKDSILVLFTNMNIAPYLSGIAENPFPRLAKVIEASAKPTSIFSTFPLIIRGLRIDSLQALTVR